MKNFKFLQLTTLLLSLMFTVGFTACSSDDDDKDAISGFNDYFIEVTVSGGGYDAASLSGLQTSLNAQLQDFDLYKLEKDEAVEIFDYFMEEMKYDFIDGMSGVKGTLKMTFQLKTTKGVVVKTSTLNVTDETAWLS